MPGGIEQKWYVVDAENEVVGRLAARIATVLRGKHKPEYTPHVDTGDFIVVINADKVRFTGKKETDKEYSATPATPAASSCARPRRPARSSRPSSSRTPSRACCRTPSSAARMFSKLNVYAGPDHPHAAQQPEPLTF